MSLLDLDAAYNRLFDRPVDEGGREYWTDQYNTQRETIGDEKAKENVLRGLRHSNEYRTDSEELVSDKYLEHFGREGDAEGIKYWTDALVDGRNRGVDAENWIDKSFINSPEGLDILGGNGGTGGNEQVITTGPTVDYTDRFTGINDEISNLRSDFEKWQTDMQSSMNNMWGNYSWGDPRTVGGVRTQNELPGWAPKKGGTSGFFGRGGSRFGLTSSSLNI